MKSAPSECSGKSVCPHARPNPYRTTTTRQSREAVREKRVETEVSGTKVKVSYVRQFEKNRASLETRVGAPSGEVESVLTRLLSRSMWPKHPVRPRNSKTVPQAQCLSTWDKHTLLHIGFSASLDIQLLFL